MIDRRNLSDYELDWKRVGLIILIIDLCIQKCYRYECYWGNSHIRYYKNWIEVLVWKRGKFVAVVWWEDLKTALRGASVQFEARTVRDERKNPGIDVFAARTHMFAARTEGFTPSRREGEVCGANWGEHGCSRREWKERGANCSVISIFFKM